jgi:hypothetical protein
MKLQIWVKEQNMRLCYKFYSDRGGANTSYASIPLPTSGEITHKRF